MTTILLTVADNYTNFVDLEARGFNVDLNGSCTRLLVQLEEDTTKETALDIIQSALTRTVELIEFGAGKFMVQPAEVRYVRLD